MAIVASITFRGVTASIDDKGWIHAPFLIHLNGPSQKQNSRPNRCRGFAMHSVVGKEAPTADGVPNHFWSLEPDPKDPSRFLYASSCQHILRQYSYPASWNLARPLSQQYATWIQMYPLTSATWTTGGSAANEFFMPVELEGGLISYPHEPISDIQMNSLLIVLLLVEVWNTIRLPEYSPSNPFIFSPDPNAPSANGGWNMIEHGKIVQLPQFAGLATSCASGRYARFSAFLKQGRQELFLSTATPFPSPYILPQHHWFPNSSTPPPPPNPNPGTPQEDILSQAQYEELTQRINSLQTQIDNHSLTMMSGAEEKSLDRATRLTNAHYRISEISSSTPKRNSIGDHASSAIKIALATSAALAAVATALSPLNPL